MNLREIFSDEYSRNIFLMFMVKGSIEEWGKRLRYSEIKRALKDYKKDMSDSTLSDRLKILVKENILTKKIINHGNTSYAINLIDIGEHIGDINNYGKFIEKFEKDERFLRDADLTTVVDAITCVLWQRDQHLIKLIVKAAENPDFVHSYIMYSEYVYSLWRYYENLLVELCKNRTPSEYKEALDSIDESIVRMREVIEEKCR